MIKNLTLASNLRRYLVLSPFDDDDNNRDETKQLSPPKKDRWIDPTWAGILSNISSACSIDHSAHSSIVPKNAIVIIFILLMILIIVL